jgi:hypothetical protein
MVAAALRAVAGLHHFHIQGFPMSIMTDARLRLLEARVAEIERRLAEVGTVSVPDGARSKPPTKSTPRAGVHKTSKRSRKTP